MTMALKMKNLPGDMETNMGILEDKLASLAQDNNEPGVSFQVADASTGRKRFSSMEALDADTWAPAPKPASVPASAPTPVPAQLPTTGQTLISNLDDQLKAAQSATDSEEAIKFLSLAKGSIAATKAEFQKEAESAAMAEYGIPAIQADIEKQRRIAQSNPYYVKLYGSADSDEVIQGEARLRAAKAAAEASTMKRLQTNPTYQALLAKSDLQERLTEHHVMKLIGKQDQADAEAEALVYGMPAEQKKLMYQALGVPDGDNRAAVAARKMMPPARRSEFDQLLQSGERAVPTLALSGNIFAERVAIDNEARVFDSRDIAMSKLKEVKAIASSDAAAATALASLSQDPKFLASKTPEQQAVLKKYVMEAKTGTANKEQQAEHAKIRTDIARWSAVQKSQAEFDSDITKLQNNANIPVPSFLREAQADPKTGIITKAKAIELVMQSSDPKEIQRRQAELTTFYDAGVKKRADSFYFSVSPLATEQLRAQISLGYAGMIGKDLGKVGRALGVVAGDIGSLATAPGKAIYELGQQKPGETLADYLTRVKGRVDYRGFDPIY